MEFFGSLLFLLPPIGGLNHLLIFQSIEIQKRIGAFSMALGTINKCLSEAICALSRGRLDGESRTAGLIHSGNEILETYKYHPEVRSFHTLHLGFLYLNLVTVVQ